MLFSSCFIWSIKLGPPLPVWGEEYAAIEYSLMKVVFMVEGTLAGVKFDEVWLGDIDYCVRFG